MRGDWISKLFGKYLSSDRKRVLLTKRDRSIQRSVDLLKAMAEESSNGENLSPSTLTKERWRLPSASSFTRAREIQRRIIHDLPQPDSSSSYGRHGTPSPFPSPEGPIAPDRSTTQKPTSDLQHGSKTDMGGNSGLPITQDDVEDSETGCRYCTEKDPICAFPSDPLAHGMYT